MKIFLGGFTPNPAFQDQAGELVVKPHVQTLARSAEADAKSAAPRQTGALQASITSTTEGHGRNIEARVVANVPYAGYVEFGTRYMGPRSYLRRALMTLRSRM